MGEAAAKTRGGLSGRAGAGLISEPRRDSAGVGLAPSREAKAGGAILGTKGEAMSAERAGGAAVGVAAAAIAGGGGAGAIVGEGENSGAGSNGAIAGAGLGDGAALSSGVHAAVGTALNDGSGGLCAGVTPAVTASM